MEEQMKRESLEAVHTHTHTIGIKCTKKNDWKEEKAITLVALVITIVVLLILAAVAIITLTGENSIIAKSQKAKEKYNNGTIEEEETLESYFGWLGTYKIYVDLEGNTVDFVYIKIDADKITYMILDGTEQITTYSYKKENNKIYVLNFI